MIFIIEVKQIKFLKKMHIVHFFLNFICFTSIIKKANGTYICVLEGMHVGVMWSNVVEETGEPGENHRA